jgi:3-deoxy-D-manno-octulosonate 8-phosphate phosphatase (KDO 8-P phosphatase)
MVQKLMLRMDQILYAGDDLPDLAPMLRAGISAAPADAATEVLDAAYWKLKSRGGNGAFREMVERLLRERGDWESILEDFKSGKSEAQKT